MSFFHQRYLPPDNGPGLSTFVSEAPMPLDDLLAFEVGNQIAQSQSEPAQATVQAFLMEAVERRGTERVPPWTSSKIQVQQGGTNTNNNGAVDNFYTRQRDGTGTRYMTPAFQPGGDVRHKAKSLTKILDTRSDISRVDCTALYAASREVPGKNVKVHDLCRASMFSSGEGHSHGQHVAHEGMEKRFEGEENHNRDACAQTYFPQDDDRARRSGCAPTDPELASVLPKSWDGKIRPPPPTTTTCSHTAADLSMEFRMSTLNDGCNPLDLPSSTNSASSGTPDISVTASSLTATNVNDAGTYDTVKPIPHVSHETSSVLQEAPSDSPKFNLNSANSGVFSLGKRDADRNRRSPVFLASSGGVLSGALMKNRTRKHGNPPTQSSGSLALSARVPPTLPGSGTVNLLEKTLGQQGSSPLPGPLPTPTSALKRPSIIHQRYPDDAAKHCAGIAHPAQTPSMAASQAALPASIPFSSAFMPSKPSRRKPIENRSLAPEEKLRRSRERNRDHSRKSRQRKKDFMENLKKQVQELAPYRMLVEEAHDLISAHNPDEQAKFLYASSGFHQRLGIDPVKLLGTSLIHLVSSADRDGVCHAALSAARHGETRQVQYCIRDPAGEFEAEVESAFNMIAGQLVVITRLGSTTKLAASTSLEFALADPAGHTTHGEEATQVALSNVL